MFLAEAKDRAPQALVYRVVFIVVFHSFQWVFIACRTSNMLAEAFAVISYRRFPTTSVRISSYIGGKECGGQAKPGSHLRLRTLLGSNSGSSSGVGASLRYYGTAVELAVEEGSNLVSFRRYQIRT